ncbi:MAG: tetratricopeptide repeat protein, partial [Blastocatellia bacterium]|nr:tetratricopeptide repeat protein [Blastocatellia bacterium]
YLRAIENRTLAVLPIVNKSDAADAVSLSGLLREDIVNRLSRLSNLQIKAPTVVPDYENQEVARQKVGRDFNVDASLFGTLAPQGELIVLQFALVNAENGSLIWQEEYRIKPAEALALQQDLSYKITSKLQLSLSEDENRLLSAGQTENAEAYKMYIRGRYFWSRRRDKNNIQKAIDFFNQAIEEDPAYAKAYAGLADCYILRSTVAYGALPMEEARSGARYAATKALELDPMLCEAHTSMAMYQLRYEWNWQEAEREFKLAISLNPSYAPAYFGYSNLLALTGRLNEAVAKSETAKNLDPFSPASEAYLGLAFYRAGRYDEAVDHINEALRQEPELPAALYFLGYIYQQQGRYKESIDSLERVYSNNKLLAAAPLGYSYAKIGRRDKAQEMLDELERLSKQEIVPPQEKAIIYVGLGDKDRAFILLQESCKERFATFPFLLNEPILNDIRPDPRFADLLRRANLTQ